MYSSYRKKPVVIRAIQWTGQNIHEVLSEIDFSKLPNDELYVEPGIGHTPHNGELTIPTLERDYTAKPGDWIIIGAAGEVYLCKPDIFEAMYEPV